MIVPFAPGGASDIVGRIIQPALAEQLKQQVVVDNRGGAAGNIGVEVAARATARRLQLPARQRRHDGDQPELLHQVPGAGPARADRRHAGGGRSRVPGRPSHAPGEKREGDRGLPEGESGQAQLRLSRAEQREPARDGDVPALDGHESRADQLQGRRRACRGRTARQRSADDVRHLLLRGRTTPRRAACACSA